MAKGSIKSLNFIATNILTRLKSYKLGVKVRIIV